MSVTCETLEERYYPYYSRKLINCMMVSGNEILTEKRIVSILETQELPYDFAKTLSKLEGLNNAQLNRILKV